MKVVDVIAEILKREGVEFLSCYPTNALIEAAAAAGHQAHRLPPGARRRRHRRRLHPGNERQTHRRVHHAGGPRRRERLCRHHYGVLRLGAGSLAPRSATRATPPRFFHFFRSARSYAPVTKWAEEITLASQVAGHHAARIQLSQDGPARAGDGGNSRRRRRWKIFPRRVDYAPVKRTVSGANARDVAEAAKVLVASEISHYRRRAGSALRRSHRRAGRARRAAASAGDDAARR